MIKAKENITMNSVELLKLFKSTATLCSYDGVMHYSFDYAQNVQ